MANEFNIKNGFISSGNGTINGTLTVTSISAATYYNLPSSSSSINEGRILYVSTTGNDSTGTIGDLSKPYLTLEAARTASSSGDSIYVFAGSYTATTTSTNGLAKDGISYYFEPNTTVTKSSSGDLFNMSTFTIGFNVYGKANFVKNTNSGYILYAGTESSSVSLDFIFECNNITQSAGHTFTVSDGGVGKFSKISVNNVTNSSGNIFNLSRYGNISITGNYLKATAGKFLTIGNGNYILNIIANKIECTADIAFATIYNSTLNCDVTITTGVGSAYELTYGTTLNLKGYTNLINVGGGSLYHNGVCVVLTVSAGVVKECHTYVATVSGGEVNLKPIENYPGSLTQSGGIVYINSAINSGYSLAASITGGRLFMNGIFYNNYTYGNVSINGANAEVIFDGKFVHGGTDYVGGKSPFTLTNGKLRLRGNIENILTNVFDGSCVEWVGGYLICDGVTLITSNSEVPPIICSSSAKNLRTYAGGLTTNRTENGGTLTAKKQKYKFTVVSVASTSLTLNDGSGGNETFTESNTGVYGTTASLAQRMASLINASGTLDLTASQDTPGTDAYFYVESDTAGSPYTLPSYTNLTPLGIRANSYAMTEVIGGIIIENSNVL